MNKVSVGKVYSLWLDNIPCFSSVIITTILNSLIARIYLPVFMPKSF